MEKGSNDTVPETGSAFELNKKMSSEVDPTGGLSESANVPMSRNRVIINLRT